MAYEKRYGGFILWLVFYIGLMFAPLLLPGEDYALMTRLCLNAAMLGLAALMAIIRRTERVYWINGVTFEQARDAGSARRKAFAAAHLKRVGIAALAFAAFSAAMQLCGAPWWADIVAFCAALFIAAGSMINIKL